MIVQKLFADATMALEDLHSVALEGQCRDHDPDRQRTLATDLRAGIMGLDAIACAIALQLGATPNGHVGAS